MWPKEWWAKEKFAGDLVLAVKYFGNELFSGLEGILVFPVCVADCSR